MTTLVRQLSSLGIIDQERLTTFYPSVRDRYDISVLQDPLTEVLILSSEAHISLQYYQDKPELPGTPIRGDVVVIPKLPDDIRRAEEFGRLIRNKRWLDFGCGLGGLLDELGGQTQSAVGLEPAEERAAIATRKGHTVVSNLNEVPRDALDIITLFHVFEHLTTPLEMLAQIKERLVPGGKVLIEVPHARDALFTLYDSEPFKRFTFWSEHLILHTRQSLGILLKQAGFTQIEIAGKQRYPVANHLHWLARQKPGGQDAWPMLNSPTLDSAYETALAGIDRTDTLIAIATAPDPR